MNKSEFIAKCHAEFYEDVAQYIKYYNELDDTTRRQIGAEGMFVDDIRYADRNYKKKIIKFDKENK